VKDAAIDTPTDGTIASGVDAAPDAGVGLGPFAISANHRYFIDDAGKPCFWLGDTQWDLFVAFSQADAQSLLQNRHDKGFNAVQVMILGVGGGKRANAAGAKPFRKEGALVTARLQVRVLPGEPFSSFEFLSTPRVPAT